MANRQKKRPLSMMMVEPQFDFQSEEPLWRQKQQHKQQQQQNFFFFFFFFPCLSLFLMNK
jgi:hypothetical protein